MSDQQVADAKKKLLEINKTITALDPAIRSAAFEILKPYYFDNEFIPKVPIPPKGKEGAKKTIKAGDAAAFFESHDHTKPKDNVYLISAWLYSQYGCIPITTELCRRVADDTGITLPSRPDATMRMATNNGKSLFKKQGKGFSPTVHGELYLKDTYTVAKGNLPFLPETEK
jgi:hypothetical protein